MATMSNVEELEAQLAAARNENTDESLTGDIDGEGGIYLNIHGERFECRRVSVSYQMMKFAKAQRDSNVVIPKGLPRETTRYKELSEKRNSAGMLMMATMLETVNILLKPAERDRFDEYMSAVSMGEGLKPSELEDAIGEVIAAASGEQGKAGRDTSSQSSTSLQTTNASAPADLSHKATANA